VIHFRTAVGPSALAAKKLLNCDEVNLKFWPTGPMESPKLICERKDIEIRKAHVTGHSLLRITSTIHHFFCGERGSCRLNADLLSGSV
jgi:hypothetical protein